MRDGGEVCIGRRTAYYYSSVIDLSDMTGPMKRFQLRAKYLINVCRLQFNMKFDFKMNIDAM